MYYTVEGMSIIKTSSSSMSLKVKEGIVVSSIKSSFFINSCNWRNEKNKIYKIKVLCLNKKQNSYL